MIGRGRRPAQINLLAVFVLVGSLVIAAGLLGASHFLRRLTVAREALQAGRAALNRGEWNEAARQLRRYLSKYPNDREWLARYGEACLRVRPITPETVGMAIGAYRRLLRLDSDDRRTVLELIRLYRITRDFAEMNYICREWLENHPQDNPIRVWLAKGLIAQREYRKASEILQVMTQDGSADPEVYVLLSEVSQSIGREGAAFAKQWLDQGLEKFPDSATLLAHRAKFNQRELRDNEAASRDLEAVSRLQPTDPWVRMILVELWMQRGQTDRAAAETEDLLSLDLTDVDSVAGEQADLRLAILRAAASIALSRGDHEKGVALADTALSELRDFRWAEFLPTAVELYLAGGRLDQARAAIAHYRQQLEAVPGAVVSARDHFALLDAMIAAAENRPYTVINLLEPVINANPRTDLPWKLLAQAYEAVGQRRRALAVWESCLQRRPNDPEVVTAVLNAYLGQRRWSEALALARRSADLLPPDLPPALLQLKLAELRARAIAASYQTETADSMEEIAEQIDRLRERRPEAVDLHTLRAFVHIYQGKPAEAIRTMEEAVEHSGGDLLAEIQLADLCARLGERDRAVENARRAVRDHPRRALPHLLLAHLLRGTDRTAEARQVLEQAVDQLLGPEKVKVQIALGRAMLAGEDRTAGIELLRGVAEQQPDNVHVRLILLSLPEIQAVIPERDRLINQLRLIEGETGLHWRLEQAKAWMRGGQDLARQKEIIELLKWCMRQDIGWSEPVMVLGDLYERIGQENLAEEAYRTFLNRQPEAMEITNRLLALLQRQNRHLEAWNVLRRLPEAMMKANPHRAWIALANNEFDEAIDALQMRLEANPQDAGAKALLAQLLYLHKRQPADAARLVEEALALNPDLEVAAYTKVSILHHEGRDPEAIAFLDGEVARRGDFRAYLMRAKYYETVKRLDLAEKDYLQLISLGEQTAKSYEIMGDFYLRTGRVEEAIQAWETGLQREPANVDLQRPLIRTLISRGNPAERERGRQLLEALLTRLPRDTELLFQKANLLLSVRRLADIQEAVRILEQIVAIDSQHVGAWMRLIELAHRQADTARLEKLVSSALGANPRNIELIMAKAQLEKDAGRFRFARSFAQRALDLDRTAITPRTFLVDLEVLAGNLEAAEAMLQEAMKIAPDRESVQLAQVQVLNARAQRPQAIKALVAYHQKPASRRSPGTLLVLAELYRLENNLDEADKALRQAEEIAPEEPGVILGRLKWYASQRRYDELIAHYEAHAGPAPDSGLLYETASLLAFARDPRIERHSLKLFQRYTEMNPDNIRGFLALAQIARQVEEYRLAEKAYRIILQISPYQTDALNNLAWLLATDLSEPHEALDLANKGLERDPDHPYLLDTRGMIYFKLGRYEEARRDLERCLSLENARSETRISALATLGMVFAARNQPERARVHLQEALRLDQKRPTLSADRRQQILELLNTSTAPAS